MDFFKDINGLKNHFDELMDSVPSDKLHLINSALSEIQKGNTKEEIDSILAVEMDKIKKEVDNGN